MKYERTGNWVVVAFVTLFIFGCQPQPESVSESQHANLGVLAASVSEDGRYSLVSTMNAGAGLWDLQQDALLFQWHHQTEQPDNITAVAIAPDNSFAATAEDDAFIVWNMQTGKARDFFQVADHIRAMALSNNGRHILLGLDNGQAIHLDLKTQRRLEFRGHAHESVASVDLSKDGRWAISGGNDYRAILWDSQKSDSQFSVRLLEHENRVTQIVLSGDNQLAFTAGIKGDAFVWDLRSGDKISQLKLGPREYVLASAAFSHDGKLLVTGAPSRNISLWDVATGARLQRFEARTRKQGKPSGAIVYAVAFSQDDRFVLTESSAGFGEKWQVNSSR